MEINNEYVAGSKVAGMDMPHVTSFFWCCSLKTGAVLISVLHLLLSVLAVAVCSVMAVEASQLQTEDRVYAYALCVIVAIDAGSAVHALLACTLVYGVFLRKTCAVKFWVLVMLVLYVAALVFVLMTAILCGFNSSGSDIFLSFVEGLLAFTTIGYFILCVFSYYLMLKSAEELDLPNKIDY